MLSVNTESPQGISKGTTGLYTAMILGKPPPGLLDEDILNSLVMAGPAAHAASPATASALMHELKASQPAVLQRITSRVPDMLPKGLSSYSFVAI